MSTVNVGTLIDLGISATKTSVSSSQESGWASSYVSGRTTELINEGYSPSIAEQMTYCEIGLKISLDLMASGTTTAIGGVFGGFVGDAFAGPFGIVPGQWIGSGLGMWAGNLFSGVDQAMAQAMNKQAFGGDNPEDQDIDLSKIPAYMSSTPMKETPGLFQQAEAATEPIPGIWRDPLLVDLDGDGIETTTLQNGTYFDHDKNGFAQESAWVGADDGVLAFDKNADGVINNGGEIFGDNYVLSNGQTATTGFQALADLDSNSDGVINSSDTNFASIKVMKVTEPLKHWQQQELPQST